MSHFGLLCPAASGHLHPMTSLGRALLQRGHRVTLVGIADAGAAAAAAGIGFEAIGTATYPPGASRATLAAIGERNGLEALRATLDALRRSTALLLQEAPQALRAAGVEMLLIDQASFAGPTVAEQLALPFVSVSSALLLNREPGVPPFNSGWAYSRSPWARLRNRCGYALLDNLMAPIRREVRSFRRQAGLPPLRAGAQPDSRLAQICQQPAAFEFPRRRLPACLHFTGPLLQPGSRPEVPFPWERLDDRPLIYASLGTLQNRQLGLFATIAAACHNLDAQLVIGLGGGCAPEDLPPLAGSPLVVGYAPQLALLQRAVLTITHAGLNTVLESLSEGVPLVAIPITNDQPGVAARIAWSGCGAVVPLRRLSVGRLRAAIEQGLHDPGIHANARRLQRAIQRAGGVARAATIVEQVAATGRPVLAAEGDGGAEPGSAA
ncbi:MAG: glycosyltransferase [Synechococcaceae cyanobacterium]